MSDLWCINILGPDDIHACASKEQAEGLAERLKAHFGPLAQEKDVLFDVVVIPWTGSAEQHAANYRRTLEGWGAFVPEVIA